MDHPVHYFIHVPKTAGVTIRTWLLEQFARDELVFVYAGGGGDDAPVPTLDVAEIARRIDELPANLRVFFGHFPFEPDWFVHPRCRGLGFVREPRARVRSWQRFVARRGARLPEPWMQEFARRFADGATLREVWRETGGIRELDNGIVRLFAHARVPVGAVGERELQRALDNVDRHFDHVGHVDWFDASMRRIAAALGKTYTGATSHNVDPAGRSERAGEGDDEEFLQPLVHFDERFVAAIVERFPPDDG